MQIPVTKQHMRNKVSKLYGGMYTYLQALRRIDDTDSYIYPNSTRINTYSVVWILGRCNNHDPRYLWWRMNGYSMHKLISFVPAYA